MSIRLLHPWLLAALALLPVAVWVYLRMERKGRPRVVFSDIQGFKRLPPSKRVRLRHAPLAVRVLAMAALVFALARPQTGDKVREIMSKGIDIMIVVDNSTSMAQPDLDPNRLGAAKAVVKRFIRGREEGLQNDRIGLVAFSRIASTRCPLTVDYSILRKIVDRLEITRKEFDGTAIGTAIATAAARLKQSEAKSKVVILVTDGQNNTGIDPLLAAAMAKSLGIKIYTIGVVPETFMQKVQDRIFGVHFTPAGPRVDETQMKEVSRETEGRYFRAEDEDGLVKVFSEIDRMEKTEVKIKEFYRYSELFLPWVAVALGLVLCEQLISRTILKRIP